MANNDSGDGGFWTIVGIIAFVIYAYISSQTPSSKQQYEYDHGYDIHVKGAEE